LIQFNALFSIMKPRYNESMILSRDKRSGGRSTSIQGSCVVLQRKPFAFELFFCLANAGFFTFS